MVLDLGPCPAEDALSWSKFARRIVVEIRSSPDVGDEVTPALLDSWSAMIERWCETATGCNEAGRPFRWVSEIEPEMAEFLMDGLDRCLHSPSIQQLCTEDEIVRQRPFTILVVRSFVNGLASEGEGCLQYADQIMTSLGGLLPD